MRIKAVRALMNNGRRNFKHLITPLFPIATSADNDKVREYIAMTAITIPTFTIPERLSQAKERSLYIHYVKNFAKVYCALIAVWSHNVATRAFASDKKFLFGGKILISEAS